MKREQQYLLTLEEIDPRAHKFYQWAYHGRSEACPSGSSYFWDNDHPELVATEVYKTPRYNPICVYCGETAKSIQAHIPRGCYDVTGHTCHCAGAMDEVEHAAQVEALQERHRLELAALKKQAPKAPGEILDRVLSQSWQVALERAKDSPGERRKLLALLAKR